MEKIREIIFQGKRIENGEWVIGQFLETSIQRFIITGSCQSLKAPSQITVTAHEIIPETLCLWSGYVDTEEQYVFEHDLFFHPVIPDCKIVLEWDRETAGFIFRFFSYPEYSNLEGSDYTYPDELRSLTFEHPEFEKLLIKRIGNIFDDNK